MKSRGGGTKGRRDEGTEGRRDEGAQSNPQSAIPNPQSSIVNRQSARGDVRKNVVLIGYRGCGKTTVGRLLADRLSVGFVDTDERIAAQAGTSIAEIFASEGEAGFRQRESRVIAEVAAPQPTDSSVAAVISVGGGAVLSDDNMDCLRRGGRVVWLTCSPEVLHERIVSDPSSPPSRPALTARGGLEEVRSVLGTREPYYRKWADLEVSTDHRSPEAVAADIVAWLHATSSNP
ncbi:MAG: shikimate kinase [Phycisphaerae bacterium]